MLAGQGEELADGPRAGLAQGLEQPLDHGAEHLVGLQVQRRPRQPRVAPVQQGGAEVVQPADGPVEQGPDDRLGGRVAGQFVQVALDDGGGVFLVHGESPAAETGPPAVILAALLQPYALSRGGRETLARRERVHSLTGGRGTWSTNLHARPGRRRAVPASLRTAPPPPVPGADSAASRRSARGRGPRTAHLATLHAAQGDVGPENETATGPNYVRQYQIIADIADGQTVTNLDLTDVLPGNLQFVSVDSVVGNGSILVLPPRDPLEPNATIPCGRARP